MLALSCQVIGNVGSSTMCFLLEVRVQIPLFRDSIFVLNSFVATESVYGRDGIGLHCCHG